MNSKIALILFTVFIWLVPTAVRADLVSLNDGGVHIDGGSMGAFTLEYPILHSDKPGGTGKILEKSVKGNTATIKYDSGATLTVQINGSKVTYDFQNVPNEVSEALYSMYIPFSLQQGGKWKMGDGAETIFPLEKPPKPHIYQNHSKSFSLINFDNTAFTINVPDSFDYLELTDFREWNNSAFGFTCHVPFNHDHPNHQFTIISSTATATATGGAPAKPITLVDEFGQIKLYDWPDKVKSEDELKADVKSEQDYYDSLKPPTFDKFGGLPDSGKKFDLQATGFFHVEKKGEKWMLVDPDGNLFFHLGVCSFQPGDDFTSIRYQNQDRRKAFDWLPPRESEFKTAYKSDMGDAVFSFHSANMIRKYGKPITFDDFQSIMIDRVRKWGFNSIGAFSGIAPAVIQAKSIPYVSSLPYGSLKDIPGITNTWDPFDPANVAQIDAEFAKNLPKHADDPLLIGFFLTNEPLYEDIPKVVSTLKGANWACKRELVQMLSDKYKTIDAFNQAWGLSAASFDALNDTALNVKTKAAFQDMNDFTGKFLETYFKLVADTFHKYDTHHMLIGNRFQSGTINNEQLCAIAGKYLDIMSFNYYTYALDKDFLSRIYKWTGRPMFLSEFNYGSSKESGLTGDNCTQQERGLAYRNYIEQADTLGFVVGAEWFTLLDEASTGRWFSGFTGERGNSGLISVTDRPYKPMLAEMMKANYDIYNVLEGARPPYTFDNPRFTQADNRKLNAQIPHARGAITLDGSAQNWPGTPAEVISGKRVVIGTDSGGTEGAFKVCWDEKNLYVLVNVVDPTPMLNKQTPANAWNGDGVEVFLGTEKIDQGGTLLFSDRHLLLGVGGAGKALAYYGNSPQQYACDTIIVPSGDGKGYTLEAAIPWEALGITPKVGAKLLFDIGINDSTDGKLRQHQIMWNGTNRNSGDRTHWGTGTLLE